MSGRKGKFDLNDFRRQLEQMMKMGPTGEVPGFGPMAGPPERADVEGRIRRFEAIIDAMTPEERADPHRIDEARREQIAKAAGAAPDEVSELIRQCDVMADFARQAAEISATALPRALIGLRGSLPEAVRRAIPHASPRPLPAPVEVRRLRPDQRLSPEDRRELRRLWEVLARMGRTPPGQEPWFSAWDRDVRLWEFTIED
jgi:hypothetical protein